MEGEACGLEATPTGREECAEVVWAREAGSLTRRVKRGPSLLAAGHPLLPPPPVLTAKFGGGGLFPPLALAQTCARSSAGRGRLCGACAPGCPGNRLCRYVTSSAWESRGCGCHLLTPRPACPASGRGVVSTNTRGRPTDSLPLWGTAAGPDQGDLLLPRSIEAAFAGGGATKGVTRLAVMGEGIWKPGPLWREQGIWRLLQGLPQGRGGGILWAGTAEGLPGCWALESSCAAAGGGGSHEAAAGGLQHWARRLATGGVIGPGVCWPWPGQEVAQHHLQFPCTLAWRCRWPELAPF